MKKIASLFTVSLAVLLLAFAPAQQLQIGDTSPALKFNVQDFGGNESQLSSHAGENGLLVVFSCNTCPFVVAWENRYNEVYEAARKAGVGMVLLNSNEAFRAEEDSPENMRYHADDKAYLAPYLVDPNHKIADAFGAKTTPHVFLFNSDMKLAYKGAIDDNHKDKDAVEHTYLKDALASIASGDNIEVQETKALGCSIKRVSK